MKASFLLLLWLLSLSAYAQKQKIILEQIWFGYSNQTWFSDKWGSIADVNFRKKNNYIKGFSQRLLQFGLTRYLKNNSAQLTAAFAYVDYFPSDAHPGISQPELRPWQQVS